MFDCRSGFIHHYTELHIFLRQKNDPVPENLDIRSLFDCTLTGAFVLDMILS